MKSIQRLFNREQWILIGIISISTLLRVGAAFLLGDQVVDLPGTADQISYHTLALRILGGHGFTFGQEWWPVTPAGAQTAMWSYLYTLYLVGVYAIFGPHPLVARVLQALLVGILQPLIIYLLGKRLFNPWAGMIAAAVTGIYAYFIYYAACLMTEPFYITAILAAFYFAIQMVSPPAATPEQKSAARPQLKLAIYTGLCLGAAILLRQLFMIFVPFLFLWVLWVERKRWKGAVLRLCLAGGIIAAMILPFTIYNYARFGRFVLLNTNSGYAFYWGNHPIYGTHFVPILTPEMGTYQDLIPAELRSLNEAALDSELLRRGLQFVVDDPGRYILLSLSRIPAYFMFWPSPGSGTISNFSRVFSFGIFLPFMLAGLIRSFRKTNLQISSPILLSIGFIAVYTLIHLLTWALVRYRLPVDAFLLIFAGSALDDIRKFVANKRALSRLTETSDHSVLP